MFGRQPRQTNDFSLPKTLIFPILANSSPERITGLMLVRLPDAGRLALAGRIAEVFRSEDVESWAGCFLVLSGHKLRILRPASE